ncbi:hypothetical protein WJX79_002893 [Trebouxia sp. C0005]
MLQLYKLNYASCIGALLLLTGGAHSRPYDQVSRSSGTVTGGVRNFQRNQIARPDEGLLMHCNVTGPCVIGRTAGQTSGSNLRQRQVALSSGFETGYGTSWAVAGYSVCAGCPRSSSTLTVSAEPDPGCPDAQAWTAFWHTSPMQHGKAWLGTGWI